MSMGGRWSSVEVPLGMRRTGKALYFPMTKGPKGLRNCLAKVMVAIRPYMVMRMFSMKENHFKASTRILNQWQSSRCYQTITVLPNVLNANSMEKGQLSARAVVFSKKTWSLQLPIGRILSMLLSLLQRTTTKICWPSPSEEPVKTGSWTMPLTFSEWKKSTTRCKQWTSTRKKTRSRLLPTGIQSPHRGPQITKALSIHTRCGRRS